jgi:hypothetical protein
VKVVEEIEKLATTDGEGAAANTLGKRVPASHGIRSPVLIADIPLDPAAPLASRPGFVEQDKALNRLQPGRGGGRVEVGDKGVVDDPVLFMLWVQARILRPLVVTGAGYPRTRARPVDANRKVQLVLISIENLLFLLPGKQHGHLGPMCEAPKPGHRHPCSVIRGAL